MTARPIRRFAPWFLAQDRSFGASGMMVVRLGTAGAVDPAFGDRGRKLYDVRGPDDPFFGVALSPGGSRIAAVGYLGRETPGQQNDDGAVLWLQP